MTQQAIFDAIAANTPRCVVPDPGTQLGVLLRAMQAGERLTVGFALSRYNVYALSQRIGELKKMGWPILSRTVTTPTQKRISEYWMAQ